MWANVPLPCARIILIALLNDELSKPSIYHNTVRKVALYLTCISPHANDILYTAMEYVVRPCG